MNIENDQRQKFEDQFAVLVKDASKRFHDKWDHQINFINPSHNKWIPSFNPGAIQLLSPVARSGYEILRLKYFEKSL